MLQVSIRITLPVFTSGLDVLERISEKMNNAKAIIHIVLNIKRMLAMFVRKKKSHVKVNYVAVILNTFSQFCQLKINLILRITLISVLIESNLAKERLNRAKFKNFTILFQNPLSIKGNL